MHDKVRTAAVDCASLLEQICCRGLTAENHDAFPENAEGHEIPCTLYDKLLLD